MSGGINLKRLRRLWNHWGLRVMVLTSLSFQIFLILIGHRRTRRVNPFVNLLLWSVYVSADVMANAALGVLLDKQVYIDPKSLLPPSNSNNQNAGFWSPFLLLHLGGPDNFTAFSFQDIQLGFRHLLGLIFQVGVASYVFITSLLSSSGSQFWIVSIPMFIAGIIKYWERTWALLSASKENKREIIRKKNGLGSIITNAGVRRITLSHFIFRMYKPLFDGGVINRLGYDTLDFFMEASWEDAFKAIEMALQFMYECLYTKAYVVHTPLGYILRFISFSSILSALMLFLLVVDKRGGLDNIDTVITYILLVGALVLEIYHVITVIFSEWAVVSFGKLGVGVLGDVCRLQDKVFKVVSSFRGPRRWSNTMAQYDLFGSCLEPVSKIQKLLKKILNLSRLDEMYVNYQHTTDRPVTDGLKEMIYLQRRHMVVDCCNSINEQLFSSDDDSHFPTYSDPLTTFFCYQKRLANYRGDWVIKQRDDFKKFVWSIECAFDKSIMLWYLATHVCYHSDLDKGLVFVDTLHPKRQASMDLSNYMLYLLATRPILSFSCPLGTWLLKTRKLIKSNFPEPIPNHDQFSKYVLGCTDQTVGAGLPFEAGKLARSLEELKSEKWDLMSKVWVEMLAYAADKFGEHRHAEQLRKGGELLTHVQILESQLLLTCCLRPGFL